MEPGPRPQEARRPYLTRRVLVGTGCAVILIASAGLTPATASAAHVSSSTGGANIRTGPTTSARSVDYFKNGRSLSIVCYEDNGWAQFSQGGRSYWSNRWFRIHYRMGRYRWIDEFIFAPLVAKQPRVSYCPKELPPADS